jgi:AraC family transcriptional regulator
VTAERKLGSVWQRAITRRGSITIVPALNTTAWRLDGKGEIMHFYLPPALLRCVWEKEHGSGEFPIVECLGAFDPRLATLVETFDWEMRQGVAGYALYAEAVLTQIAICLLRQHSTVRRTGRGSGSLRRTVEEQLVEYIEANLRRDITLSALADLAGLKPAQFSKLFKASFGFSPYQYVLRRRVEWAKGLLRDGKLGVAEVAVEVGFAHQAHFTTMFKRTSGSTPGAYRAALRT